MFGREPAVDGHQNWGQQIGAGTRSVEQVAAQFMAGPEFQSTYGATSDTQFVTLLFDNIFGRAPAQSGLTAWVGNLQNGMSRAEVVMHFSDSAEHKLLTAAGLEAFEAAHDATVFGPQLYRLYEAVFGRAPAQAGFQAWVDNLEGGMSFAGAVDAFMASQEFTQTYGNATDTQFIERLFTNVLGRPPAQSGLDAWVSNLQNGMTRAEVVAHFVDSAEFVNATAAEMKVFMRGFGIDDRLEPGPGDSLLSGGALADMFVFGPRDDGRHEVADLEAWDHINLRGFGYTSAAEALSHVTQSGQDAVFVDQGVRISFADTDIADITGDMILV